jgi:hypothetical protein
VALRTKERDAAVTSIAQFKAQSSRREAEMTTEIQLLNEKLEHLQTEWVWFLFANIIILLLRQKLDIKQQIARVCCRQARAWIKSAKGLVFLSSGFTLNFRLGNWEISSSSFSSPWKVYELPRRKWYFASIGKTCPTSIYATFYLSLISLQLSDIIEAQQNEMLNEDK